MKRLWCALTVALCACGNENTDPGPAAPGPTHHPLLAHPDRTPIRHDFGIIRHGEVVHHEFEVPFPPDTEGGTEGYQPRGFQAGCVCGDGSFAIVARDGTRREVNLGWNDAKILQPDERLLFRLTIDTRVKEAVDMAPLTSHGNILLQDSRQTRPDLTLPMVYTFAIDAPVVITPFARVALGRMSRHSPMGLQFELSGDQAHRTIRFLEPVVSDDRLKARLLEVADTPDRTILEVVFSPRGDEFEGALPRMQVEVPTEGAGDYTVILPVTGVILPDVEVEPPQGISFGAMSLDSEAERFVNLMLHDRRLPSEWIVQQIRSRTGEPLKPHFEARLETLEGLDRTLRLHLRYLGTLTDSFRGVVELVPSGQLGPIVSVEFRGFRR